LQGFLRWCGFASAQETLQYIGATMPRLIHCSCTALMLSMQASAFAQLSVQTGLEYSSGTYGGATRTDVVSAPFNLRYETGKWAFKLGTSWLSITGDGSAVPILGSAPGNNGARASGSSGGGASAGLAPALIAAPAPSLTFASGASGISGTSGTSGTSGSKPPLVTSQPGPSQGASTKLRKAEAGATSLIPAPPSGPRQTISGFGDITASATYNVYDQSKTGTSVDMTGSYKFATADVAKGLGTGFDDYSAKVSVFKTLSKTNSMFGSIGHKVIGTAPGTASRSQSFGSVGAIHKIDGSSSVSAALDFASASRPGLARPLELSLAYRYKLGKSSRLSFEIARGLSEASPDWSAGVTLTVALE
jgi:hypothetical protein